MLPDLRASSPGSEPTGGSAATVFAYPFRIFFLSAAGLAVLLVPAWLILLLGGWRWPLALPALAWHQHEMLFGFLQAAIAGFLLTAVCAWTGTQRLHALPLLALWLLWLVGRLLMLTGAALPPAIVVTVDLAFLPLVMLDFGWRVLRARQYRQLLVLAVLAGFWLMDLGFHLYPGGVSVHAALLLAMLLMLVIGGRITPAFSGNWLRLQGRDATPIRVIPALERAVLAAMLAVLAVELWPAGPALRASAALLTAGLVAMRLLLWRGWLVGAEPLLWILHLALAWIPVALLLLAASAMGWVAPTAWVHAAGTGAIGALILGVMSRVALGHTGRPLQLPPGMTAAFVLVLVAGLIRVATAVGLLPWRLGVATAAALWIAAYLIFLIRYWSVLSSPRLDGKPG